MSKALQLGRPMEVDIELPEAIPTDSETEADLKALTGMTEISLGQINSLRRIGVKVKRQGILETQRGAVFVTQGWILGASSQLYRLLLNTARRDDSKPVDVDEVCKLADHLAKLSGKQAELSAVMLSHEPKEFSDEPPPPAKTAFEAGAVVVGGNAQVHLHTGEKSVAAITNGS